jgi:hypothetical protein
MWQMLKTWLYRLRLRAYRRRIEHALALNYRGEVRCDGLRLHKICSRMEIQWRPREIHPWDRHLPQEERERLFVAQSLADTEAVISKLFESLPQVDVIDLMVLHPTSDATMMAGTVHRTTLAGERRHHLSIRMRLSELGVRYRLAGAHFEALNSNLDCSRLSGPLAE